MSDRPEIVFASLSTAPEKTTAILCVKGPEFGERAARIDSDTGGALRRAAEAASFEAKPRTSIELLAPAKTDINRLVLIGCGTLGEATPKDWTEFGGFAWAQLSSRKATSASLIVDPVEGASAGETAARLAQGALLRSYNFRKYLTKKTDEEAGEPKPNGLQRLVVHTAAPDEARVAFARLQAVADGVNLARDLVNEPPNALGPVEFAERMRELEPLGVQVDILDVAQLEALKMNALLGVAQGSARPARVVVMQWNGAKSKRQRPLCIVGKGVVFDSGGLSIKPAQGMEEMKGDMGGAACVAGLMHALAARKATVSAVGLIGLVENLPSGTAQRPGDIVTSMSGQTIEVLNTDAEGRLVLADLLWYAQDRFKPRLIVDLATLTGAIIVALGKEYAGLFANDDKLATDLHEVGEATGERVWRMPMAKAYDKMIDSKTADMKNIGGRYAGAVTAAQFLQRFVKDTPWAHLDIAGVAMDSVKNDINQSWGWGWGVRLLDQLIADKHEKAEKPPASDK